MMRKNNAQPAGAGAGPSPSTADAVQGMSVTARTQSQLVIRRFLRHRGALAGMVMFWFIFLLAATSIGWGPIPSWWDKSATKTGSLVDSGRPTIGLIPDLNLIGVAIGAVLIAGLVALLSRKRPTRQLLTRTGLTLVAAAAALWWVTDNFATGMSFGEHPFGQDNVGRDYFALTMRGTQVSLIVAFLIGGVATVTGTIVGAVAGYFRGWVESVLMRITDVMITIPTLVFAAVVVVAFARGSVVIMGICIGLVTWTQVARLVRGEVLSIREKEFVEAARSVGTSAKRIIFKHILPNVVGIIIVSVTLAVASGILLESALSFLGLGVQPPDTSLGRLITDYNSAMSTRPWLFYWPGVFIIVIALSVNFIGDGLRDAFDPRQNRVRD